jgi:poly-D-alanine transfer protein DltD
MLQYPETVANRPLLKFALENLADGSSLSLACYDAVLPLGIVQNAILCYQDHWSVVRYLWTHPETTSSANSPRVGGQGQLDWQMLHREADASYGAHSNNNEFGLDNQIWERELRQETLRQSHTRSDKAFLRTLQSNLEWVDLELLLRELTEFGARTLIVSMPIHGGWYDQCGVTYAARRAYYQKLREFSARYHTAVVDFADHDADRSFCRDVMGHPAPSGLVYYNQVLDDFFHDAIPSQSELPEARRAASSETDAGLPFRPAP